VEEPVYHSGEPQLMKTAVGEQIQVLVPYLPSDQPAGRQIEQQQLLLEDFFRINQVNQYIAWYYTPMALSISEHLPAPKLTVYDCMDELSAFKNAPLSLKTNEQSLLEKADIVFTGGSSLFEAKKLLHEKVHLFPSSIDKNHFAKARKFHEEPLDQADILHPRIGFFGVIDERLDIELLKLIAELKPAWQFIIIGPVVKIDPASLPVLPNIHYLGSKSYNDLPAYMSGWKVALIPFAINESTRFISPTKTPEYLAGGLPVVSSYIRDVATPYGDNKLVSIAVTAGEFISEIETAFKTKNDPDWLRRVDAFLANMSWDITWSNMAALIEEELLKKEHNYQIKKENDYV
jgi:UDP-galactopyranose mutase